MVIDLHAEREPAGAGAKAERLHWLATRGHRVPAAWAVTAGGDPGGLADVLVAGRRYAVRSSANLEDGADFSFAGQFRTELDVASGDVAAAVERVRASTGESRAARYLAGAGLDAEQLTMAVIVQEMATPVVSGVVFSRNPLTGLSETIVEAVAGRGDALVSEGHTPQRWVYRWGDCISSPPEPLLTDAVVEEIVATAGTVERDFGAPVDLEWVWDGTTVQWVQVREITGLDDVAVYSNRIAREVLPGIIKPLVWSVNVPLVNSAWIDLFSEMIGPNGLRPEDLARSFGYRAYFDMGTIGRIFEQLGMPRETLELLLGFEGSQQPTFKPTRATLRHLPRMLVAAGGKLRYGRRVEALVPQLDRAFTGFEHEDLASMTDPELLAALGRLRDEVKQVAYANIVVPLLANAYFGGLRRRLERLGIDIALLDFGDGEGSYDPAVALADLHAGFARLPTDVQAEISASGYGALAGRAPGLRAGVDRFIERFGHFSESGNDFSVVPWREDRDHVVRLVADHVPAGGAGARIGWEEVAAAAGPVNRFVLAGWYRRARAFRHHRDVVSFHYTRGYGLFRDRYLEVGRRLTARGAIGTVDDVWYLTDPELRGLFDDQEIDADRLVRTRRAEIEEVRDAPMPEIIYGDDFVPVPEPRQPADRLTGIPTSRGVYRGPVRVVQGRVDFDSVVAGDVLVVPFSDVGWTPLFARAGAVVAESGGILSHSSIVAREYGIPCVVSVPGACRIAPGTTAVVDGYTGTVVLER